jgi:hypothetical protein
MWGNIIELVWTERRNGKEPEPGQKYSRYSNGDSNLTPSEYMISKKPVLRFRQLRTQGIVSCVAYRVE